MLKRLVLFLAFALAAMVSGDTRGVVESDRSAGNDEHLISVNFPNEDILVVLRHVADVCELNLVVPETLVGRTSVRLRNVTWRQVFDVVLTEQDYTYVEDGNIVRVVSRAQQLVDGQSEAIKPSEPESIWDIMFRWNKVLIIVALAVTSICNVGLFIGVLVDSPPARTRFVPKLVWALLMLLGGVTAAAGYWLIHYSKLRPAGEGSERMNASHESS
jgi:hypothetical protein